MVCIRAKLTFTFISLYNNGYPCYLQGVKGQGCGIGHPSLSSAEVKERVKVHFYILFWAFLKISRAKFSFSLTCDVQISASQNNLINKLHDIIVLLLIVDAATRPMMTESHFFETLNIDIREMSWICCYLFSRLAWKSCVWCFVDTHEAGYFLCLVDS
jgi:hypothetical protein